MRTKVTCLKCKEFDVLDIDDSSHVVYGSEKKFNTNFIAYRWRGDFKWGFQCVCGNDSRLSTSESGDFDKLVRGDKISLEKIAASLLIPDDKKFRMENA